MALDPNHPGFQCPYSFDPYESDGQEIEDLLQMDDSEFAKYLQQHAPDADERTSRVQTSDA